MRGCPGVVAGLGLAAGLWACGGGGDGGYGTGPSTPAAFEVTVAVDATADRHSISPDVYGVTLWYRYNWVADTTARDLAFARAVRLPINRHGGNGTSRYNWLVDSSNAAADWYFMGGSGEKTPTPGLMVPRGAVPSRRRGGFARLLPRTPRERRHRPPDRHDAHRIISPQSFWGVTVVMALDTFPFVYLLTRSALLNFNVSFEEVARTCGASPLRRMFLVTLPLLRPSIVAGVALVILYVVSDFGAVSLLRYHTDLRRVSANDRTF